MARPRAAGPIFVDHERLAEVDPGSPAWLASLAELGLDRVDPADPQVPPALADLLRLTARASRPWLGPAIAAIGLGIVLAGAWATGQPLPTSPKFWLTTLIVLFGLSFWANDGLMAIAAAAGLLRRRDAARRDASLAALQARPFVLFLDDKIVENLPSASWLSARIRSLATARAAAEARRASVSEAIGRMAALRADLGESGRDPHLAQLVEVRDRESALLERIDALNRDLSRRKATLDAKRATLGKRAELFALQRKTADLVGGVDPTPERIAAEIEVDVADLKTELAALQAQIAADSARSSALAVR